MNQRRWALAVEDFRRSCQIIRNEHNRKPINCWTMNGAQNLSNQQVSVLHELCLFREEKARAVDRPLFKVINDKALVNIAAALPEFIIQIRKCSWYFTETGSLDR